MAEKHTILGGKVYVYQREGIRPDEANWLEYRDIEIVEDDATGETILEIEVRGKRGVGYPAFMHNALRMRGFPGKIIGNDIRFRRKGRTVHDRSLCIHDTNRNLFQ